MMTLGEFYNLAAARVEANRLAGSPQRYGQLMFNCLSEVRPEMAAAICSETDEFGRDPFYDDVRLPAFWDFVDREWTKDFGQEE